MQKAVTFAAAVLQLCSYVNAVPQTAQTAANTYDYIVIGSGPGGGPLAANLAIAGKKVLLMEAGDDQSANPKQIIPGFAAAASEDENMRWDFFVKHYADKAQRAKSSHLVYQLPNGTWYTGLNPPAGATELGEYYPRSGTLGGCSTHNAGIVIVPPESDWNEIVALTGDSSWNPTNMRNYFKTVERNLYLPKGTPGHGFNGYLSVNYAKTEIIENDPNMLSAVKGAIAAVKKVPPPASNDVDALLARDINVLAPGRDGEEGVYQIPLHFDENGKRSNAGTRVLQVLNAKNPNGSKKYPLTVQYNSLASKILFSKPGYGQKPKAIGVEYLEGKSLYRADPRASSTNGGVTKQVYASKEIIVAGGAFNTPQLLKLSGIGPKAELAKFGIPLLVDAPGVGNNLQDHYETAVIGQSPQPFTICENCTFGFGEDPCLAQWLNNTGPYRSGGFYDLITKRSSVTTYGNRDLYYYAGPIYFTGFAPGYSSALGPPGSLTYGILKAHPNNRAGTVTLRSANPRDVPDINFNYFAQGGDQDLQALYEAIQLGRQVLAKTPAPGGPQKELWPGPQYDTPAKVKQFVKDDAYSHHATSTAAIGRDGDPMAVLDSKFRVRGVQGLRVVDASAFPRVPGAFPIVAIFMMSEKASDVILNG